MGLFDMGKSPKKLKRIPYDLVSYIQIETEAIKDYNDKQMISSYCLDKLKIVEWYIQLVETKNEKYIVPHSLAELKNIRSQLQECHKQIMKVKIKDPNDRSYTDIQYPKGYEG